MRVVVTGATGNVGTSLLRRLAGDDRVTSIVASARRPLPPGLRFQAVHADDALREAITGVGEGP